MATSSSLALADEVTFDAAVGLQWHGVAERMDYYAVGAETVNGRDIGLLILLPDAVLCCCLVRPNT